MSAHRAGRHRYGHAGLRYCRDIPEVRERLERTERTQHVAASAWRVRPAHVVGAVAATSAAVVSGWLASSTALADIIVGR
jgi:ABC-type nitrate/sulfonate/bicarbonate transport system permease component